MESVERSVLLHQVVFFSPYFLFSSVIRSKQYLGVPRHIFANRTNIRHKSHAKLFFDKNASSGNSEVVDLFWVRRALISPHTSHLMLGQSEKYSL